MGGKKGGMDRIGGRRGDNERIVIKERMWGEGDLVYKTLLVCRFYQI